MAKTYEIAVIPGDGIGKEVVPEGMRVLEAVARRHGFALRWREYDWSCERFAKTGAMMPPDGLEQIIRRRCARSAPRRITDALSRRCSSPSDSSREIPPKRLILDVDSRLPHCGRLGAGWGSARLD